jgi:hypothetical protein
MLSTLNRQKVWLAQHRVDFRKQHSGLLAEAYKMSLDPFIGDVIIFVGKNRRRIKLLYADSTGVWVSTKIFTLEAMKTKLKFMFDPSCTRITMAELSMLMEGSKYILEKKVSEYKKPVDVKAVMSKDLSSL